MRKKCLVTGATGFIGSHLIPALVERGDEVHVIVRSLEKLSKYEWGGKVKAHVIDISNAEEVQELYLLLKPDEIYHLAGSLMHWGKNAGLETLIRTNILSTAVCMEALEVIPNARFVFPGSFAELGGKDEPIREDHIPEPQEFYGISKLASTLDGQQLALNKGYNIVIGRIFTAYGPRQPKGKLVEVVINGALTGETITLTHPDVTRDFIHVSDIVSLLILLGSRSEELKGEIFNVASGDKTSLRELTQLVKKLTNGKNKIEWHPERRTTYEKLPWQADMTKVRKVLDWKPTLDLEQGLQVTIDWMKANK